MSRPYFCHYCLRRLAVRAYPPEARVVLRRAGFISLSSNRHTDSTIAAKRTTAEGDGAQKTPRTERVGPNSTAGGRVKSTTTEDFLEDLFSSARHQSPMPPIKSRYSRIEGSEISKDASSPHSRHELLTTWVDRLPAKETPLEEQWAAFMQMYGSKDSNRGHLSSESGRLRLDEEGRLRNLLLRLTRFYAGRLNNRTEKLPTPAEAVRIYVQANIMTHYLWETVLWILLGAVVKLRDRSSGVLGKGSLSISRLSRKLLNDILEVWKLSAETPAAKSLRSPDAISQSVAFDTVSAHANSLSESHTSLSDGVEGKNIPTTLELEVPKLSLQTNLPDRFLSFIPRFRQSERIHGVFAAAVMTLDLLCPASQSETHGPKSAYEKEFIQIMASVVNMKILSFDEAERCLAKEKVAPGTIHHVRISWEKLPQRAMALNSLTEGSYASAASEPRVIHKERRAQTDRAFVGSDLINAVKSGDGNAIDGLWQKMEACISRGIINDYLFGQFLWAHMCMRRPVQASHVWSRMVELGRNPSQNHWLALLRGCLQAKDYDAMRDIWQRMNASGVRPGLRCWTIWIQGLILSGQWQQGLKALDELSKVWDSSALPVTGAQSIPEDGADDHLSQLEGEKKDLLVPSIVPINAAISSLLIIRRHDVIGTFLEWAELHKTPPDTATFNILLRPAIRSGRPQYARNILRQMESSQCQPDVHTFTIIIDGLFRNSESAFKFEDSEAQVTAVADIFRQMKDTGIEPSTYTYTSMLDGLLGARTWQERKKMNIAAARAVLEHMAGEGIKPSPHIYTILISHYFNLDPPDLASIDGLWNRMQLEGGTRDHIFYDRMIEGYARVGAVEKMLAFLRRMPQEGKSPGWVALHAVLLSLVKAQEWDMVQDLVQDVGGKDGIFRNTSRFSWGRRDFWDLVDDVRRNGIELPVVEVD